jgi:hypothetical protein
MKNLLIAPFLLVIVFSCAQKNTDGTETSQLSDVELIAKAYGFDNFNETKQLQYTFNVSRHDTLLVARAWAWDKETGAITMINNEDTLSYQQDMVTEELKKADHSFINDKYWLLFPFQLVWDTNVKITNSDLQTAPLNGTELIKLIVQYGDEGGYTPGDAYDLYLDKDWIIQEWEFRKSGKESPGSVISWAGYEEFNGIKVATDHYNKETGLRIYFSDIKFE